MKEKILFIAPHLSTGGLPQYLFKQMESLVDDFDVYCIEWENVTGGVLVIQRNRVVNLLGDRLITLPEDKHQLFTVIEQLQPDIIHIQEIPELFMSHDVAQKLYHIDRSYKLIETSHDSSFDTTQKIYLPDKFLMVSKYQENRYRPLGVPCAVVEYPIENKIRTKTREEALQELGLDPTLKHVINVGLFTPRKNQAEVIEYAKMLKDYPIQFHFLGNQAENFEYYWGPLMKHFPSNCKWWNERDDVDKFYEAADLFLFTSRGHNTDHETMPLVIREALSWKTPSLIYNLPVYLNYFNKYPTINYLNDNIEENAGKILDVLNIPNTRSFKMDYGFSVEWNLEEQKVYYSCQKQVDFPVIVSIKEYKSDAVLWASNLDSIVAGVSYWMLPISKHHHSYEHDPHFTGIKFCIYRKDTEEQIFEQPFFHKFVNVPTVSLSNFIPYRLNYMEFFVQGKFSRCTDHQYGLVVDVGANAGVFTEYMLSRGYAQEVVAVECDSIALKDLQRNFKRTKNVTIIPKALHYSEDPITFYQFTENPVVSTTLSPDRIVGHGAGLQSDNILTVDTVTLEQLVNTYGTIDLIKIDIEGAEYEILFQAKDEVFSHINHLMVECHFFEEGYKQRFDKLKNRLSTLGYIVEEINPNPGKLVDVSEVLYATKVRV